MPSVNTPVTVDHVREVLRILWSCTTLADAAEEFEPPAALAAALAAAAVEPPRVPGAAATEAEELEPGKTAVCEALPPDKPLSLLLVL